MKKKYLVWLRVDVDDDECYCFMYGEFSYLIILFIYLLSGWQMAFLSYNQSFNIMIFSCCSELLVVRYIQKCTLHTLKYINVSLV